MRIYGALLAVAFLVACGPHALPNQGGGSSTTGTVEGTVLSWPCAPVERVGSPCPGRPFGGVHIELDKRSNGEKSETTTDATGHYSIQVAPGTYDVSIVGYIRLISGVRTVDVAAGQTVRADFVFDSGIR